MMVRITEQELTLLEERTPKGSVSLLAAEVRRLRGLLDSIADCVIPIDMLDPDMDRQFYVDMEAEVQAIRAERS